MSTSGTKRARNRFVAWKQDASERLIEAYKQEEQLYAIDHPAYHNRDARVAAWCRIAAEFNITGNITVPHSSTLHYMLH